MVPYQNPRVRVAMLPQTVGTATANVYSNTIDGKGFDSATFIIEARSATTAGVPTLISIEHADDTNTASFAAIASISSGLPSAVNATAVTNQDAYAVLNIDLRGKKRYLRIGLRAGSDTPTMSQLAILGNASAEPIAAAAAGARYFNAIG